MVVIHGIQSDPLGAEYSGVERIRARLNCSPAPPSQVDDFLMDVGYTVDFLMDNCLMFGFHTDDYLIDDFPIHHFQIHDPGYMRSRPCLGRALAVPATRLSFA